PTLMVPTGKCGRIACAAASSIRPIIAGVENTAGRLESYAAIVHSKGTTHSILDCKPLVIPEMLSCRGFVLGLATAFRLLVFFFFTEFLVPRIHADAGHGRNL